MNETLLHLKDLEEFQIQF